MVSYPATSLPYSPSRAPDNGHGDASASGKNAAETPEEKDKPGDRPAPSQDEPPDQPSPGFKAPFPPGTDSESGPGSSGPL